MANIKIELSHEIIDGQPVTFVAPCDCTAITGLKVHFPNGSKVFTFKDAHGNDLTGVGNLFSVGAYVKAILDVANCFAYIQNADTNSYLENNFAKKAEIGNARESFSVVNATYIHEENVYYTLSGNSVPLEGCNMYRLFASEDENPELLGKTVRIRTYAYGDMAFCKLGQDSYDECFLVNPGANITENPESGVCEFEITIPSEYDVVVPAYNIPFCEDNGYTNFEIYVKVGTVWDEIKKLWQATQAAQTTELETYDGSATIKALIFFTLTSEGNYSHKETAVEGMTWEQFVVSEYNTNGYKIVDNGSGGYCVSNSDNLRVCYDDNQEVAPTDEIENGAELLLL